MKSRNLHGLMSLGRSVTISLFCVVAVASASGQTNSVRELSLKEAVDLALKHNFDVRIEQFSPQIARFNYEGAEAFYDPNLEIGVVQRNATRPGRFDAENRQVGSSTSENTDVDVGIVGTLPTGLTYNIGPTLTHNTGQDTAGNPFGSYEGQAGITLRQPLLRNFKIDAARRNILIARKDIEFSELGLSFQLMDVIRNVEQTYFDLVFARENIRVQEKGLELANRLVTENRRRVEVGTLAPLEQRQSEAQAADTRAQLISAQGAYEQQQNALKNLISDNYREWHGVEIVPNEKLLVIPEKFDVMDSWQRGVANRPDLNQLRIDVERRDINVRYQQNQMLPSLDLVGSYGRAGSDDTVGSVARDIRREDYPFYSYGVVLSVPLSRKGVRSAYANTKAVRDQAKLRVEQAEQTVMVQIDDAIKSARTNLERVEATRAARQYAEEALAAEGKKLEAGRSTSFVILQLQRDLTSARSQEIRAISDYNKALSQIAFTEGSTLLNNNLELNVRK